MKIISSIYIAVIAPFICGAAVITTAQLYSSKPEHKFCAGLNPARGVSEMVTYIPAGNNAKRLSSVNHTTKTIHHHHQHAMGGLVSFENFRGLEDNLFGSTTNFKSVFPA